MAWRVFAVLLLLPDAASADHHRPADPAALEVGKVYILDQPFLIMQRHYATKRFGVIIIRGWNILKVLKRKRHGGELWYRFRRIQPETLDRTRHTNAWAPARMILKGRIFPADGDE